LPDIVRVLRIVEYIGPRDLVEDQVAKSIHGSRQCGPNGAIRITAVTLGEFAEIMKQSEPVMVPKGSVVIGANGEQTQC
jgi:hypothetical protein